MNGLGAAVRWLTATHRRGEPVLDERIVLVEDSAELRPDHPHVVGLEARPANVEGAGAIGLRDLVRHALRMRPDRLVVGEVRDADASRSPVTRCAQVIVLTVLVAWERAPSRTPNSGGNRGVPRGVCVSGFRGAGRPRRLVAALRAGRMGVVPTG